MGVVRSLDQHFWYYSVRWKTNSIETLNGERQMFKHESSFSHVDSPNCFKSAKCVKEASFLRVDGSERFENHRKKCGLVWRVSQRQALVLFELRPLLRLMTRQVPSARVSVTVTSHFIHFPSSHRICVNSYGRLPTGLGRPTGFCRPQCWRGQAVSARSRLRRVVLQARRLKARSWVSYAICIIHGAAFTLTGFTKLAPKRSTIATPIALSLRRRAQDEIGSAWSQSPLKGAHTPGRRAWWDVPHRGLSQFCCFVDTSPMKSNEEISLDCMVVALLLYLQKFIIFV